MSELKKLNKADLLVQATATDAEIHTLDSLKRELDTAISLLNSNRDKVKLGISTCDSLINVLKKPIKWDDAGQQVSEDQTEIEVLEEIKRVLR